MARPSTLPVHPRMLVLNALRKHKQPLSAYDLLARLKPHGVKGAMIVYRALDTLMAEGVVHKIQKLNAYVACNCRADHAHSLSVLTICGGCDRVAELHDHAVIHQLEGLRGQGVALAERAVIELPVTCRRCAGAQAH